MEKKIRIEISEDQTLLMKLDAFGEEEEIDLDRLLRTDLTNIAMELVTFPVILNKIGILLADANFRINVAKLAVETLEGQLGETLRSDYFEKEKKQLSNEKVSEAIARHPKYLVKKQIYFKRIKEQEYINSLYWSCKSKDEKLTRLTNSMQAGDMEESIMNNKFKKFNYIDTKILRTNL